MNVGMLWFDNDPRTALTAKVARAADYYSQKYGLVPDLCLVHPTMLAKAQSHLIDVHVEPASVPLASSAPVSEAEGQAGKVALRSDRLIQPGYLWIGKEDQS
jgi:hypothetical protein